MKSFVIPDGYRISKLPSGYWCVFRGKDFLSASFLTYIAAEQYLMDYLKKYGRCD